MRSPRHFSTAVPLCLPFCFLFQILFAGCAGPSRLDLDAAAKTVFYQPGVPNFDMEAVPTWRDNSPGIDLYVTIPNRFLSFVRTADGFAAACVISVRVVSPDPEVAVIEKEWLDSAKVRSYEATQRFETFTVTKRLAVQPGQYRVEVIVLDQSTSKRALRFQDVVVFSLEPGRPRLSRMWLTAKQPDNSVKPVAALHLTFGIDSLQIHSMLYNAYQVTEAVAEVSIIKVRTDTSVATPPYAYSAMKGSLLYRGIEYDHRDTVHVLRQSVVSPKEGVTLDFPIPTLRPGMYILEQSVRIQFESLAADTVMLRGRYDLSIKGADFPRPSTIDALVDPLAYLAKEEEMAFVQAAQSPQEKRKRFELFWLKKSQSEQSAANLIKQYYGRVEDANLFFSTFKEGWKTDRGMIYIIFGPPSTVAYRLRDEIWLYSYNEQDPVNTYVFERVMDANASSLFPNYVLLRQPYYSVKWDRTIDLWRRGVIGQ